MYKFLLLFIIVIFSCKNKTTTQSSEIIESPPAEKSSTNNSFKNLIVKESQNATADLNVINKRLEDVKLEEDEERSEQQLLAVKLLTTAQESYSNRNYKDCISNAAQIPLSNALFSPAQYLIAYSFFHNKSFERAAEIYKGISQNKDFFKGMDRQEAAYMHILSQYHFYKKSNDKFQKDELKNAIKYYLSNYHNNNSTFIKNVKMIKENI